MKITRQIRAWRKTRRMRLRRRDEARRNGRRRARELAVLEHLEPRWLMSTVNVSGTLPNGTVWSAGNVYRVTGDVTVAAGNTLTIQPGAVVKFNGTSIDLLIEGTVNAIGTSGQNIVFTADEDDTAGGDTNGDGGASSPGAGYWGTIVVLPGGSASFDYGQFRYGLNNMVHVDSGTLSISNSIIEASSGDGVRIDNANPTLTDNTYRDNLSAAISMDLDSNPTVTGVTLSNNAFNALEVDGGTLGVDSAWTNPDITYQIGSDVIVPLGTTLTVGAGQVIKITQTAADLIVNGVLDAQGTSMAPIYFTSYLDDEVGGDTNNDADASSPGRGYWGHVYLQGTGHTLDYVAVRYGLDDALTISGGGATTITNSTISESSGDGVRIVNSDPTLTNVTFVHNYYAAVSTDLSSNPVIGGVTVSDNGTNGLRMDGGTSTRDLNWTNPDITYQIESNVTIDAAHTLTVAAGQVIKFVGTSNNLIVNGVLDAQGASMAPIYFTHRSDDAVGGDTNNDGSTTTPNRGSWGHVYLQGTGHTLDYVAVRYGLDDALTISGGGATTITNSTISEASGDGVRIVNSDPTLTNVTFVHNYYAAVSTDLSSNPVINGVTVSNNGTNGLRLDGGTSTRDLNWTNPDITYLITSDVAIDAAHTLTVAPGQVIKIDGTSIDLIVNGALDAQGTGAAPIYFTDDTDDAVGGDTNNDGSTTTPNRGSWGHLYLYGDGNTLDFVTVRYGLDNEFTISGATNTTITNSAFSESGGDGLRIENADPTLTDVTFVHNYYAAVSTDLSSNPVISGVTVSNNGTNGLRLDGGTSTRDLDWTNPDITYLIVADVTIDAAHTLTVAPGQVIKIDGTSTDLFVNGALDAQGTSMASIYFTDDADDTIGGDTNNDGSASTPGQGYWGHVFLQGTSHTLDHVTLRHGLDNELTVSGAGVTTISNSTIAESGGDGLRLEGSSPTLTNLTFIHNYYSAVSTDLSSDPVISGVTMINNGTNGMYLDGGTLPGSATLDNADIVHVIGSGDLAVAMGDTLTIGPGVVFKFVGTSSDLHVSGTLIVNGGADAPVYFTSLRDDAIGGDTNNDGAASLPYKGIWGRINLNAVGGANVIDHAHVSYGLDASINVFGDLTLTNSVVRESGYDGVEVNGGAAMLAGNLIVNNYNSGVTAYGGAVLTAINNTVDGNTYGVNTDTAGLVTLANNSITFNSYRGVRIVNGASDLTFNDVYNPAAVNYEGPVDPTDANGNTSVDPRYFSRANLNFQLRSGSSLIDSADGDAAPMLDFFGNARFDDPNVINFGIGADPFVDRGAFERQAISTSDIDLATVAVDGPQTGTEGDLVSISWTVQNVGIASALGSWHDAIYLSVDGVWTPDDVKIGELEHVGDLGPGETYDAMLNVTLPGALPGDYNIIVRTNDRYEVFEALELLNNPLAAGELLTLDLPQLPFGAPVMGQLAAGDTKLYRVPAPQGADLTIDLDGPTGVFNELYISFEEVPTRQNFDARGVRPGESDQTVSIAGTREGEYIVMVRTAKGTGTPSYTITATLAGFGITSVGPVSGSNTGEVTITIEGSQFDVNSTPRLIDDTGATITATDVYFVDSGRIAATFDLTGAALGPADVEVVNTGNVVTSLPDGFSVIDGDPGALSTRLVVPGRVRLGRSFTGYIEYSNIGDTDLTAPILQISAVNGFSSLGTTDAASSGSTLLIIGASDAAPAGVLPPGATVRVPIYGRADGIGDETVDLDIGQLTDTAVPWAAMEPTLRPDGMTMEEFAPLYAEIQARAGATYAEYADAIADAVTQLTPDGSTATSLDQVFQFIVSQAIADLSNSVDGRLFLNSDADPLSGAALTLYDADTDTAVIATSLADGTFTFADVPDGTYDLSVTGFAIPSTHVTVAGGDMSLGDVIATHEAQITGGVLLGSFGVPLVNTMVMAVSDTGDVFTSDTADGGRYVLDGLPAGTYRLIAGGAPFTTQIVDGLVVAAGQQVRNRNFVLEQDATISGTLTGLIGPLSAGGAVSIVDDNGEVLAGDEPDVNGDYLISGLSAGTYDLRVDVAGYARQVMQVTVTTNQSLANVDVALVESGQITGTLTDTDMTPLEGQLVEVLSGDDVVSVQITGAAGCFTIDHIVPGDYSVRVSIEDRAPQSVDVTVMAGQSVVADLMLGAAGTIVGNVEDAGAQPVGGALVTAIASDGTRTSVTTDDNGDYRINDLGFDAFDVVLGDPDAGGLAVQSVTLNGGAPDATADFVLPVAATISGAVFEADGTTPVPDVTVELFQNDRHVMQAQTDAAGNYVFRLLITGTFGLAAIDDVGDRIFETSTATVSGGAPAADVDFVAGAEAIYGTVNDAVMGGTLEGATVSLLQEVADGDFNLVAQTETDASGNYAFLNVAPGDYRVFAEFDGRAFAETMVTVTDSGGPPPDVMDVTLDLGASTSIGGRITDTTTGDPMPGVSVRVARDGESGFVAFGETDGNGDYMVSGLPAGSYKATFAMDGRRRKTTGVLSTSASSTTVANASIAESNSSVEGQVLAGGRPVANATIVAIDSFGQVAETTFSGADGGYVFDELDPGTFTIDVTSSGSQPLVGDTVDVFDSQTTNADLLLNNAASDDANSTFNRIARTVDWLREQPVNAIEWVVDAYNDIFNPVEKLADHPSGVPAPSEGCEAHVSRATNALAGADEQFKLWQDAQRNYLPKFAAIEGVGNFLIFAKEVALTFAPFAKALDASVTALRLGKKAIKSKEYIEAVNSALKILDNAGIGNDVVNIVNASSDAFDAFRGGMITEDAIVGHALNIFGAATNLAGKIAEISVELGKLTLKNGNKIGEIATVLGVAGGILSSFMQAISSYEDTVATLKDLAQAKKTYENRLAEYTAAVGRANTLIAAVVACNKFIDDGHVGPPPPPPTFTPGNSNPQTIRTSFDPNDKTSGGFGDDGFTRTGAIPYLIQFENDPDLGATLPAQEVFVTDPLDANLDLTTVEFTGFGFDNMEFEIPAGLSFYQDIIDLRPQGVELLVFVTFDVDPDTRVLSATFSSIDPLTGQLPDDIDAGFLPVNDEMIHNGEGFFTYTVKPIEGLPVGTVITNQAEIVFDVNDPILTPIATNKIDDETPTSAVDALPGATSSTEFMVSWTGDDGAGAGIAAYNVYYTDDGGPLTMLAEQTTDTSMMFTGVEGHTYTFYSTARDNVGLVEPPPLAPDASTIIQLINLDPDGDGLIQPLTDGILVIRFLAGFTGSVLTDGATGAGATRTDPAEIFAFLETGLNTMLDVDANGGAQPLTDGILIIRYLAGFTGSVLTAGAIGAGATRDDPTVIDSFLDGYNPPPPQAPLIAEPPALEPLVAEPSTPPADTDSTRPESTKVQRLVDLIGQHAGSGGLGDAAGLFGGPAADSLFDAPGGLGDAGFDAVFEAWRRNDGPASLGMLRNRRFGVVDLLRRIRDGLIDGV
ncbi:MAG: hypothetical protein GC159_20820 [Phycisphaera sp.]|nr:hypothetical protein [Phycisphaera sp.]